MNITSTDALIIVDPQIDFCPGGALAVERGDEIMAGINSLAADFKEAGGVVVITQDYHPHGHKSFASSWYMEPFAEIDLPYGSQTLWPDHCVQKSRGAAFHPLIVTGALNDADLIIRKGTNREIDSYSAFVENDKKTKTGLAGYLREKDIKRCVFVGLAYDFCVGYSALDARSLGFEATVLKNLTRAIAMPVLGDPSFTTIAAIEHQFDAMGVTVQNFVEEPVA